MIIFGWRIERESTHEANVAVYERALRDLGGEVDFWKAKYHYAKARALVAEQFHRNTVITVKPVAMGVDSGVRIEVGQRTETEIREQ